MENINHFIEFVKSQIKFHETKFSYFDRRSSKFPPDRRRADAHQKMTEQFTGLLGFIDVLTSEERTRPQPQGGAVRLALTPEEIEGLPEELLSELSISEADRADFTILALMDEAGGVMSLDKILIALYKRTGEINKRSQLNARIYRMVQKGAVFNVTGRKGVYSTRELSDQEAADLV